MALCTCTLQREKTLLTALKSQPLVAMMNYFFVWGWNSIPNTNTHTLTHRNLSDPAVDPVTKQDLSPALTASQILLLSLDSSKGTNRNRDFSQTSLSTFSMLQFFHVVFIYKINIPVHCALSQDADCHLITGLRITQSSALNLNNKLLSLEWKLHLLLSHPGLLSV